jgi:hypothetical protein
MLAKSVNRRLGLVAFLLLSTGASAPASAAAAPTRISACPYTITAPGNYVVTRNLTATGTCISFATPVSNVALDLQGHSITGNGTGYGIACLQSGSNDRCDHVIIANGVVARFSGGIHLDGNFNTVAQMTSQQNTASQQNSGTGIVFNGDSGNLIIGSVATGNDSEGIHGGGNGFATSVSDSVASNNGNLE